MLLPSIGDITLTLSALREQHRLYYLNIPNVYADTAKLFYALVFSLNRIFTGGSPYLIISRVPLGGTTS